MELQLHGTISGTVYDEFGAPLSGICVTMWVSPTEATNGLGMNVGTGADGTYTITDVDAGTYRIQFDDNCPADPGTHLAEYARSFYGGTNGAASYSTGAPVTTNGEDLSGFDIRMLKGGALGGTISMQTSSGVTELPPTRGIGPTIYQSVGGDWVEVPLMTGFVGSGAWGAFQTYGLYPGTYRVCVNDIITGPRAYAFECWQDSATVEGATDVAVTAGNLTPNLNIAVGIPRPGFDPVAVPTEQLDPAAQGAIGSDGTATQGENMVLDVGTDFAGEWVSVWGHSTPTRVDDWVQVSSTGTVTVTVPQSLPAGDHTLVVQNASGGVVGWNGLHVVPEQFFADVTPDNTFFTEIEWMASAGISTGYPQGVDEKPLYQGSNSVTRRAMASFLYRMSGESFTPPVEPTFADVDATDQFYEAIEWMANKGISTGTAQGEGLKPLFKPAAPVSRQAMAAFLYRYDGSSFVGPPVSSFVDVPTDTFFYNEIAWMADAEISTGYPNESGLPSYKPAADVSRQAMAAFLFRLEH